MIDPDRLVGSKVLVVGDLMLDEFIWGTVRRISPEAPVPVVEVARRTGSAGGAANTAANIAALGGKAYLAGVVGEDSFGRRLVALLRDAGVETGMVLAAESRPTTTKTRVLAHNQQMLRYDEEIADDLDGELAGRLMRSIEPALDGMDACIVSDYGKGVASRGFLRVFIEAARLSGVPVIVDPKGVDYGKYSGATLVKPNQAEAGQVLNRRLRTDADVESAGRDIAAILEGSAILVTRGPDGMSLFEPGLSPFHLPTHAREVYDVTGAGDTVAGTLALAVAAGADLPDACRLASHAAAVVVQKIGTATLGLAELKAQMAAHP